MGTSKLSMIVLLALGILVVVSAVGMSVSEWEWWLFLLVLSSMALVVGLVLFLGCEPQRNEGEYVEAFLGAVEALGVRRVVAVAGVLGPVPYEMDRQIVCVYSLPGMKGELGRYGVEFSAYEGGASIGVCIAKRAEERGIEFVELYAVVPAYDFSESLAGAPTVSAQEDYKAWHDVLVRVDGMLGLGLDLSELARLGEGLVRAWEEQLAELGRKMPELDVERYLHQVREDFEEGESASVGSPWDEVLSDLFGEAEE